MVLTKRKGCPRVHYRQTDTCATASFHCELTAVVYVPPVEYTTEQARRKITCVQVPPVALGAGRRSVPPGSVGARPPARPHLCSDQQLSHK